MEEEEGGCLAIPVRLVEGVVEREKIKHDRIVQKALPRDPEPSPPQSQLAAGSNRDRANGASRAAIRVYAPRRLKGAPLSVRRPVVITTLLAARSGRPPDISGIQTGRLHCVIEMRRLGSTHRHRSLISSPTCPASGRHRERVSAPSSVLGLDRESAVAASHKSNHPEARQTERAHLCAIRLTAQRASTHSCSCHAAALATPDHQPARAAIRRRAYPKRPLHSTSAPAASRPAPPQPARARVVRTGGGTRSLLPRTWPALIAQCASGSGGSRPMTAGTAGSPS
jgi:hypothetical protein